MRQDIKQEWVKRLRSGIPQAKGVLALGEARCAVGVLCDIAVEHGITSRIVTPEKLTYYGGCMHDAPMAIPGWAWTNDLEEAKAHFLIQVRRILKSHNTTY